MHYIGRQRMVSVLSHAHLLANDDGPTHDIVMVHCSTLDFMA